jgi:hypothetical protein
LILENLLQAIKIVVKKQVIGVIFRLESRINYINLMIPVKTVKVVLMNQTHKVKIHQKGQNK